MNEYTMNTIQVGMKESFSVIVTQKMMNDFLATTGDCNPMHTDRKFAEAGGYKDTLVYGMLTASFFSTLVGVYLPGKNCLFHKCEVEWPNPVYVGDELTVSGIVKEVDIKFNSIVVYADIRNQEGKKVARAKLAVGIKE